MGKVSKSVILDQVFRETPRVDFLPVYVQSYAKIDRPLPIGYGQTNSQPSLVRQMLEWLDPDQGDKVLDVGSGSGWTSALLARLVYPKGHVYAVEKIPELVDFGRNNAQKFNLHDITFHEAGDTLGLPQHAPYDRILVSAAAEQVPPELIDQLRPEGIMIIPVNYDILKITRRATGPPDIETHSGFTFVPLIL